MTHALEWPSLTCQWLPTVKRNMGSPNVQEHSLLLGTHTTGEQNYLMVASCNLPKDDVVIDQRTLEKENAEHAVTTTTAAATHYDEDRKEVGGFGHAASTSTNTANGSGIVHNATVGKIEIRMKIRHPGEVNRARYMPQNHFFVATRGPSPEVYVFDLSKHPSFPPPAEENSTKNGGGKINAQMKCVGHTMEGYAMAWSPLKEGLLLSGSEDCTVCLWDIQNSTSDAGGRVPAQSIFKGHTDVVEDVDWHSKDPNIMVSVGDDATIRLWDLRQGASTAVVSKAHDSDINCVSWNPKNEFILATGSADKTVGIWDIRNLKQLSHRTNIGRTRPTKRLWHTILTLSLCFVRSFVHSFILHMHMYTPNRRTHTLAGHHDQVYMVDWSPFNESILGSASADRRVGIWDLSRIGMEQSAEDAEDGPPELLFLHGGHTSKVSDFSWNAQAPWTIASVSEDNVLQVWQMAEEIYAGEEGDDDDDGDDEEGDNDKDGEGQDKLLGEDELE